MKISNSSFDVKKAEILIGFISSLFEIPANDNNIEHTDLAIQSIELFQSKLKEIVKLKILEEHNKNSSSGTGSNKNKCGSGSGIGSSSYHNNKGKHRRDPELIALKSACSECRKGSISAVLNILNVSSKWIQVFRLYSKKKKCL